MLIVNVVMYAYHLEVIQIWDTFLADSNRFEFVIYVSCAMILSVNMLTYLILHSASLLVVLFTGVSKKN